MSRKSKFFQFAKRYSDRVIENDAIPSELLGRLEEALEADLVVYWGDFLHMQHYAIDLANALPFIYAEHRSKPLADRLSTVYDHLLLRSTGPQSLSRVALVGGTLALNSANDYHRVDYRAALTRLVAGANRVLMRDPYSASLSALLRHPKEEACLGCDCAFLLEPRLTNSFSTEQQFPSDGQAIVFLGRNVRIGPSMRFVKQLCRVTGVDPVWMQWLDDHLPSAPRGLLGRLLRSRPRVSVPLPSEMPDDEALGRALSAIARSRFVITDTYHLAINAWNLGVPAVCIADTAEDLALSYNSGRRHAWRDKRYEFFSLAEALPFFVHTEELRTNHRTTARLAQLRSAISGEDGTREIALERIALLRGVFRENLSRIFAVAKTRYPSSGE
jgi:hypothetical protein